jgi:hypothetical protein
MPPLAAGQLLIAAADVRPAPTAAAGAATATSVATNVYTFLTTTEPAVLAYDALGAIAVAYLTPPLAKAGLDAARGYAGDVLPTTALDCLASDSNSMLVDIRSVAQKEAKGVPDLPDNGAPPLLKGGPCCCAAHAAGPAGQPAADLYVAN